MRRIGKINKIYKMPDIVIVGYGRTQTYQIKCLKCGKKFFPGKQIDFFCEDCLHKKLKREKYIRDEHYSNVECVGNIVGWENKVACNNQRSRYNYKKVYKRDGFTCQYCNYNLRNNPEFIPLWIDHIIPHIYGGGNRMENLVVSCQMCNQIAGSKVFNDFDSKKKYILQRRIDKGLYVAPYLIKIYELDI